MLNKHKKYKRIAGLILAVCVIAGGTFPVFAMVQPITKPISNWAEFLTWYHRGSMDEESLPVSEIRIEDGTVTLGTVGTPQEPIFRSTRIDDFSFRIMPGATLVIDNPAYYITVKPPQPAIIVEPGGTLVLKQGGIWGEPNSPVVVVKAGGACSLAGDFTLTGKITLPVPPEEVTPPTPPVTGPPPTIPRPEPLSITVLFDPVDAVFCMTNRPPEKADFPETVRVYYRTPENTDKSLDLPVRWDLSGIDVTKAGTCTVTGTLTEEGLVSHGLTNPKQLTAKLSVAVQQSGAITTLANAGIDINESGWTLIRLRLPQLPKDATALRIEYSYDRRNWNRAYRQPEQGEMRPESNFLSISQVVLPYQYVNYRYQTDYRVLWLRVEIVGSIYEGISNALEFRLPASASPGDGLTDWGNEDGSSDGSYDGNRGGGGQGESARPPQSGSGISKNPVDAPSAGTPKRTWNPPYQPPAPISEQEVYTLGAPWQKTPQARIKMSEGNPGEPGYGSDETTATSESVPEESSIEEPSMEAASMAPPEPENMSLADKGAVAALSTICLVGILMMLQKRIFTKRKS